MLPPINANFNPSGKFQRRADQAVWNPDATLTITPPIDYPANVEVPAAMAPNAPL